MPVRKRLNIEGRALVFVTTAITDWLPILENEAAAAAVTGQLKETARSFEISVVGYVIMPSHMHALLGFRRIEDLSRFMQTFKSLSARRVKMLGLHSVTKALTIDGKFKLWRPRFEDLLIVSEKQFRTKLEYIHHNPVKAGLVSNAEGWTYSSARDWLTDEPNGMVEIDKGFVFG
jgi:putative transposase